MVLITMRLRADYDETETAGEPPSSDSESTNPQ
jgi:hypothetical protein